MALDVALKDIERIVSGFGSMRVEAGTADPIEKGKKSEVVVKGFASLAGVDRDGDNIDPLLFDIDAYMKNPVVYWNHKTWTTAKGNEVSIGVTEVMHAVHVKRNTANAAFYDLHDLHTDALVETIDGEQFIVKEGDKGLWVHVRVVEPEVVKMVREERAKAFSWKGALRKTHDTRELKIDMYEVSLVTVPAQHRSLFAVAKAEGNSVLDGALVSVSPDMHDVWMLWGSETMVEDTDEPRYAVALAAPSGSEVSFLPRHIVRTEAEAKAIARAFTFSVDVDRMVVLLKPTGKKLEGGRAVYTTEVLEVIASATTPTTKELSLLRLLEGEIQKRASAPAANAVDSTREHAASENAGKEGGDISMSDINTLLASIGELSKTMSTLVERQDAHEARIAEVIAKATQAKPEEAPIVTSTPEVPVTEPVAKAADESPKEDEQLTKVADMLGSIAKTLDGLAKRQDANDARIALLEKKPAASAALRDEDGDDDTAELVKRFNGLDGSAKSRVNRTILGMRMIPVGAEKAGN